MAVAGTSNCTRRFVGCEGVAEAVPAPKAISTTDNEKNKIRKRLFIRFSSEEQVKNYFLSAENGVLFGFLQFLVRKIANWTSEKYLERRPRIYRKLRLLFRRLAKALFVDWASYPS
jgi:hypothetical protein